MEAFLHTLTEEEKIAWLRRLYEGRDPHLGAVLRRHCRDAMATAGDRSSDAGAGLPTAGELRAVAAGLGAERCRAAAVQAEEERRRQEREQAEARAARLTAVARRGESAWREVENEIERRNATGYDRAVALLADLRAVADQDGKSEAFARRLTDLRSRHERKSRFIERLDMLDRHQDA